jgi:hypothetical protein
MHYPASIVCLDADVARRVSGRHSEVVIGVMMRLAEAQLAGANQPVAVKPAKGQLPDGRSALVLYDWDEKGSRRYSTIGYHTDNDYIKSAMPEMTLQDLLHRQAARHGVELTR